MQAVLINPPHVLREDEQELNLATAYLTGAIRAAGYQAAIIDASLCNLSLKTVVAQVMQVRPALVGITLWAHRMLPEVAALIQSLRAAGFVGHISIGGHTPTFAYADLLSAWPGLDSIVLGEGERTVVELLAALLDGGEWREVPGVAFRDALGQVQTSSPREPVTDLDDLPLPAWDMVPELLNRGHFISLATSRGCYGRCTFCSISSFYRSNCSKPWRGHSPKRVLQEMELLIETYGVDRIGFRDDNFMGPGANGRERAQEIARVIIDKGWNVDFYISCRSNDVDRETFNLLKQAGLKRVFLGIESGQQDVLDYFNKLTTVEQNQAALELLQELDVPVTIGFIMFTPHTSWREFTANVDYLMKSFGTASKLMESINDLFNALEIYPGTELVNLLAKEGNLQGSVLDGYSYRFLDWRVRLAYGAIRMFRRLRDRRKLAVLGKE